MIDLIRLFKSVQGKKARTNSHLLKADFTLIELSIVLVIIGLLIGGIMTGQSLIRAAEIRSISSQKEQFVTAVNTFKNKYNQIPGDTTDAQNLWGAAVNCTSAQTTAATCNGDGNALIDIFTPSGTIGNEVYLFWKHLANSGLVSGNYWGVQDGSNGLSTTSKNAPIGKINGGLWHIYYSSTASGSTSLFDGVYNNSLYYGVAAVNGAPWNYIITPIEMFALDSKIDDGKPGTGNLRVRIYSTCSVKADGVTIPNYSDTNTAIYNTALTGNQCSLVFPNVF